MGFAVSLELAMMRTPASMRHLRLSSALVLLAILHLNAAYPKLSHPYPKDVMVKIPEGDECDGGTCLLVSACPPAIKSLQKFQRHDFARCGFLKKDEIICCPNESVRTTSTTSKAEVRGPVLRKSIQVCEELVERFSEELRISTQILNGENADPGEFPHMAALYYFNNLTGVEELNCGGTLISERHVLTAAHCIATAFGPPIRIVMGRTSVNDTEGEEIAVANFTNHPDYTIRTKTNDIALILMKRAVTFTKTLHPACLYTKPDEPKSLMITGWGLVEVVGKGSEVLQKGIVFPVEVSECSKIYQGRSISQKQLCALSNGTRTDACQGDSGGPIQDAITNTSIVYNVIGVTSYGRSCGGTYPGIYTRVHSYLDWIESIVWPK